MPTYGPNAPPKATSAFILYMRHRCKQSNDLNSLPFMERRRVISNEWSALPTEQKQVYNDQAAAEKAVYEKKFAEYKKTDEYKEWLAKEKRRKALKKRKNAKAVKNAQEEVDSMDDEFASKFRRIPIFTHEFLEYNRQREMALRNIRKEVVKLEEETALLSKHVENLKSAEANMEQQIKTAEENLTTEEGILSRFKAELVAAFSDLSLPAAGGQPRSSDKASERITADNVEAFLSKLVDLVNSGRNESLKAKAIGCLKAAVKSKKLSMFSL